ncbi:MAG: DDE-type integrase/transposase/recombinase [Nanoarchaeota archaeon]|nr:DDE-type integrase/transposase/recombinase [Nanoarchaeota archaeon]
MKYKNHNQTKYKKVLCPNCNSAETIKWCKRKTQNRGEIQRYKCKSCNSCFTPDDGFFRMRNTPQKVSQSIDLFYRGVSTRKVQEHLAIFHPHNASNVSIYKWVVKYSKMISKFTNKLKVTVSGEVQVDEMECHRRISHKAKRGIDKNWFIDSIDPETKFLISGEYSKTRGKRDIKAVVSKIKERTENQIQMVTTDGLLTYPKVIKSVWGYNHKLKRCNVFHNKVNASKGEGFNHPIERLHNSVRARTKVMRGFHGSINSANAILKGYEIYYNFITKHQAIKKCPYELAIPELALALENEKNRWLGLIKLSNINN